MKSRGPAITLALLLATAMAVVVAGVALAHRTELVRETRDRETLRQFAGTLGEEIDRLERHYETHLRRIARTAKPQDEFVVRDLCDEIVGVRQFSILEATGSPNSDVHISAGSMASPISFWPTFGRKTVGLEKPATLLDEDAMLGGIETSGWSEKHGQPLYFWTRAGNAVAIVVVDPREVGEAIDRWLMKWSRNEFASVRLTGGPDRLIGSGRAVLAASAADPTSASNPDFLIPVRGRFGTWQVVSWDRFVKRSTFDVPTLTGAAVLGIAIVLIAAMASTQQRRSLKLAAQRVSFANRVSHELRAPMTNILLNLDLVSDAADGDTRIAGRLDLVREEAQRLGRMIENVLTFSRGEEGKLQLRPRACIPDRVIEAVLEQFLAAFGRRGITVERDFNSGRACLLDPDALAQIVANLLSNVEKYAPAGLSILRTDWERGILVFSVTDSGEGIAPHLAHRVFLPFERLDSRVTEGVTGTGLGLSIGRELAERMGGALRLVPDTRGTTFELRVPAPAAPGLVSVPAA